MWEESNNKEQKIRSDKENESVNVNVKQRDGKIVLRARGGDKDTKERN